jgi:hypothetical protein
MKRNIVIGMERSIIHKRNLRYLFRFWLMVDFYLILNCMPNANPLPSTKIFLLKQISSK